MVRLIMNQYCGLVFNSFLRTIKNGAMSLFVYNQNVFLKRSFSFGNYLCENGVTVKSDSDVIYSTVMEEYKCNVSFKMKSESLKESEIIRKLEMLQSNMPIAIQKILKNDVLVNNIAGDKAFAIENVLIKDHLSSDKFPFGKFHDIDVINCQKITNDFENVSQSIEIPKDTIAVKDDIKYRLKTYKWRKRKDSNDITNISEPPKLYKDFLLTSLTDVSKLELYKRPTYGTPDPEIEPSSVPCGGCGAFMHCQDDSLPGYVPSELFKSKNKGELRSCLCQRCFFLEAYDVALNVRVSPDIYEKSLMPVISDKALVIVIVDILDIPCSIWPGLFKLLGQHRPIFIVGNKIDLLPPDSPNHLINVKRCLLSAVKESNVLQGNIQHFALVSAKTGYGIEDLISKLQVLWGTKGNIYIVGCTNAGKSTLFNALLCSDMCQNQAVDLIKRATTSPWPGTTLNLLKFPLMKPTGERITRRIRRIREEKLKGSESVPSLKRFTFDYAEATLREHIGRTFIHDAIQHECGDPFVLNVKKSSFVPMGIKDKSYLFKESKWLFDTPGTVQPDQLMALLTHYELLQVLPRNMIEPRTFSLRIGQSLFLGGIARLDVIFCSNKSIRLTVFSSSHLPVTIVNTVNASSFYRNYLGTNLLKVPTGGPERLVHWPSLKPVNVSLISHVPEGESCADIVLSSAGFIAVTGENEIELRGWTPSGRGVYIRDPPMLSLAVKLKGKKIKGTPAFHKHKVYIPSSIN